MKLSISGVLVTLSPVHQTAPNDAGKNMARQVTMPVVAGADGRVAEVPYVTANSVRGQLRRHAAAIVLGKVSAALERARQERESASGDEDIKACDAKVAAAALTRQHYLSIVRGAYAASGGIHAEKLTVEAAAAARRHVFARLFGGGAFMLPAALKIESPLLPVIKGLTEHIMPAAVAVHAIDKIDGPLMTVERLYARDDFEDLPQAAIDVLADPVAEYEAHMAGKFKEREGKKAAREAIRALRSGGASAAAVPVEPVGDSGPDGEEEGNENGAVGEVAPGVQSAAPSAAEPIKKQTLDNLFDTEVMIPGLPLALQLRADGIGEAHAGLILLALESWVQTNALGGGSARGRGRFLPRLSLRILHDDGLAEVIEPAALLLDADDPAMARLDRSNPTIRRLLAACAEALEADATVQSLAAVYPTFEKAEKAEKAKAGGKKAKAKAEAGAEV
jgi:hypothetical protein